MSAATSRRRYASRMKEAAIAPTNVPSKNHIYATCLSARALRPTRHGTYPADMCQLDICQMDMRHSTLSEQTRIVDGIIRLTGTLPKVSGAGMLKCDLVHIISEKLHPELLMGQVLPHE